MSIATGQVRSHTVEFKVQFKNGRKGRKRLQPRVDAKPTPPGRVPRVSRLMALAIRIDQLVHDGELRDYAEVARVGRVTRARVTQIMNLLNLAPDIQEDLLFLPLVHEGRDPISERHIRPIVAVPDWRKQQRLWAALRTRDL